MIKSELRQICLENRAKISPTERRQSSRRIADRFFEDFDPAKIRTLHCFISIPKFNEIDTSLIYKHLWSVYPEIRTVAPRIDREKGEILSLTFTSKTVFVENAWGIREPVGINAVAANEIDIVLVPLLCFDEYGYRVGYGRGFYDKLLGGCRKDCLKVGLSYFPPIEVIDDIGGHDIRLDNCITPTGKLTPKFNER